MRKACENPTDRRFDVWPMLLETHALLTERLGRELEEAGGPPLAWYDVLVQLYMAPQGRLTMKQLAESVLLSKSGVTRLVDRMVDAGYIARDACPTDKRIVYATLTPTGRSVFRRAAPGHMEGVRRHFIDRLTDTETRTLRNALAKVIDAGRADDETSDRKIG